MLICLLTIHSLHVSSTFDNEDNTSYYEYTIENGRVSIISNSANISYIEDLPSHYKGMPVVSYGKRVFYGCTNKSGAITIPDTVEEIGDECFARIGTGDHDEYGVPKDSQGFSEFYIPRSVKKIGTDAIGYTVGKTQDNKYEYHVKYYGTVIHGYAGTAAEEYAKNNLITFIPIDDDLSSYTVYDWEGSSYYEYNINDGKVSIVSCSEHTGYIDTLPSHYKDMPIVSYGKRAFMGCQNECGSITIPDTIEEIGDYCFARKGAGSYAPFGNHGSSVGYKEFYIPRSVKKIEKKAIGYSISKDTFNPYNDNEYFDKYDDTIIHGYADTAAEEYAKENGFTFIYLGEELPTEETTSSDTSEPTLPTEESLPTITSTSETTDSTTEVTSTTISEPTTLDEPTEPTLIGDTDVNGVVELADLTLLSKHLLSETAFPLPNATARANADMNSDGLINIVDLSELINNQLGK